MPLPLDPLRADSRSPVPTSSRTDAGTLPGFFGLLRTPATTHAPRLPESRPVRCHPPEPASVAPGPPPDEPETPAPPGGLVPRVAAAVAGVAFLTAGELQRLPGGGRARWAKVGATLASLAVAQGAHALAGCAIDRGRADR